MMCFLFVINCDEVENGQRSNKLANTSSYLDKKMPRKRNLVATFISWLNLDALICNRKNRLNHWDLIKFQLK